MMANSFNNLKFIWLSFFILILFLAMINGLTFNPEIVGLWVVSLHVLLSVFFLVVFPVKYSSLLIGAYLLRFFVLIWDMYCQNIFVLPHSGADTEFYYKNAVFISENIHYIKEGIRGGVYSKILGVFFYFTGSSRIIGQYLNVLLGFSTVIIIYKTMIELNVDNKTMYIVLLFTAFFPTSLIMSAILLREILPTFFVALSLLMFIRWYKYQSIMNFTLAIIMIGVASIFHSGIIAVALGYFFMYLFYVHQEKKLKISFKNLLLFIPIIIFVGLFTTKFGDIIFYKFRNVRNVGDIHENVQSALGGAAYLRGLTVETPLQLILFAPIRAFYFLFSPLPWDWRGVADMFTFFLDALLYLYIVFYFIKNKKYFIKNKPLVTVLFISIIVVAFVYGIGVSNAGTAMRHRQKFIPLFLALFAVMSTEKKRTIDLCAQIKRNRINK